MKKFSFFIVLAILHAGCTGNAKQETSVESDIALEMRTDTLAKLTAGELQFANGESMALPFADNDSATIMVLVRHAEKDTMKNDPPLTEAGQARAEKLAAILADFPVDGVYSTKYQRNTQTVTPTAKGHNQAIQIYEAHDSTFAQMLTEKQVGKRLLIVGHSNTTPALINQLLGREELAQLEESDYGNIYIVAVRDKGQAVRVIRAVF